MTPTYLRIGASVYPVYGDDLRGWSLRADDFGAALAASPYSYGSVGELFFALVTLCTQARTPTRVATRVGPRLGQ